MKDETEKYLQDICFEENPQVLDDDMPDYFDNWLASQEPEDWLRHIDTILKERPLPTPLPKEDEDLIEEFNNLLPCLDPACDLNGVTWCGNPENPEQAQCEYCYRERFPILDKLKSILTLKNKQIEEAVSKDRERIGALLYEIDADVSDVYYKVFNPKN